MLLRRLSENRFKSKDVAKVFYASLLHTGWTDQAELERSEWGGPVHAPAAATGPLLAFNISPFTLVYIWSKRNCIYGQNGPPGRFPPLLLPRVSTTCIQHLPIESILEHLPSRLILEVASQQRTDIGSTTNRCCRKKR